MKEPTKFPYESSQPKIDVTLPVGTHILELLVEDSAGGVSDPVTIVVIVEPDTGKGPIIDDFEPDYLALGEQTNQFLIHGDRLRIQGENPEDINEHSVEFLIDGTTQVDTNIEAKILPKSTQNLLVVDVQVKETGDAKQPGERQIRVTTPAGSSVASTKFEVRNVLMNPSLTTSQ